MMCMQMTSRRCLKLRDLDRDKMRSERFLENTTLNSNKRSTGASGPATAYKMVGLPYLLANIPNAFMGKMNL